MAHIPEAVRTYRIQFYLLDAPLAVCFRYADPKRSDPATGDLIVEPPAMVMLDELPPWRMADPHDALHCRMYRQHDFSLGCSWWS